MSPTAGGTAPDPRRAAAEILADVRAGEWADRSAERRLDALAGSDRNLALELAYGVVRLQARLDAELDGLVHRPLSSLQPSLVDWLRIGLYQLRELRVPNHAAVNETVEGVRRAMGRPAAGFANAVLRRAAREGRPGDLFPPLDADPLRHLSVWGSHPAWLVERWLRRWPLASVARLVENDNRPPPVVLRLLDPVEGTDFLKPSPGVRLERVPLGRSLYRLVEGEPAEALRSVRAVVQDPAAAAVVDYVGRGAEGPILDACAAPGGKALALCAAAPGGRPYIAADRDRGRLEKVIEGAARVGVPVSAVVMDGRSLAVRTARTVLLDVPCSGTGVLRRRPDLRWRLDREGVGSLVRLQSELLEAAAEVVEPGGLLVYATCSLEAEENEHQIDDFLRRHPEYRRDPPNGGVEPGWLTGNGDLRVWPWTHGTDGAYASRLRRRETG